MGGCLINVKKPRFLPRDSYSIRNDVKKGSVEFRNELVLFHVLLCRFAGVFHLVKPKGN